MYVHACRSHFLKTTLHQTRISTNWYLNFKIEILTRVLLSPESTPTIQSTHENYQTTQGGLIRLQMYKFLPSTWLAVWEWLRRRFYLFVQYLSGAKWIYGFETAINFLAQLLHWECKCKRRLLISTCNPRDSREDECHPGTTTTSQTLTYSLFHPLLYNVVYYIETGLIKEK